MALPEKISELPLGSPGASDLVPVEMPGGTKASTVLDLGAPAANAALAEAKSYFNETNSTGILTGGNLSINADPTKFDLAAGKGYIIDNWTDPQNPTAHFVEWGAFTAQTDTYRTTDTATTVMVDTSGAIVLKNTSPSREDFRDYIVIGKLAHPTFGNIISAAPFQNAVSSVHLFAKDLAQFLGTLCRGVEVSANGANLNINTSSGYMFRAGCNYPAGQKDPNVILVNSATAASFQYRYRNGTGGFKADAATTSVNPSVYDNGTGTLADPGANKWTIQEAIIYPNGNKFLIPGQVIYNSLAEAQAGILSEKKVKDPQLDDASLRAFICVRRGGTALNSASDAYFQSGGLLGQASGGAGGGGSTAVFCVAQMQDYKGAAMIGVLGAYDVVAAETMVEVELICDKLPVGSNLIAELRKNDPAGTNILSTVLQVTTAASPTNGKYIATHVTTFSAAGLADGDVLYGFLTSVGNPAALNPRIIIRKQA